VIEAGCHADAAPGSCFPGRAGPMWLNINYMVALALASQGESAAAVALMQGTLDCVDKYYQK